MKSVIIFDVYTHTVGIQREYWLYMLAHAGKDSALRAMEYLFAIPASMAAATLVSHLHICFS